MARSEQTAYLIEVLEGPNAGGLLELVGRMLPYRAGSGGSIAYGVEQRTKTTWYPGNRTASMQVIGPRLPPTVINGVWKERYLGEDQPIDLVELFEELCNQGSQIRVSWETIVRYGIVRSVKWSPGDPVGGLTDIRWEIEFEWVSADVPRAYPKVGESTLTLRDELVQSLATLSTLAAGIDAYVAFHDFFVGMESQDFAETKRDLEESGEALQPSIQAQIASASQMADQPELPAELVRQASAAAGEAIDIAGEVSEELSLVFPANATVDDSLDSILTEALARDDVNRLAFIAMESQYDVRVFLESQLNPDEYVVIVPTPGTDFRALAIDWYGDADLWMRIAEQNGVQSSAIPDDIDEIVIPLSIPSTTDAKFGVG